MSIWGIGPCSSGLAGAMGRVTDKDLIREKKVLASIREDQEHISSIRRYGFFVKSYKHSQRTLAQAFSRRQDRKSPLRCSDSRWQARTTSQWYAASSRISFTKSSTMCQQKIYHHECSHGSCQISRMPWKSTGTIGSPGNGCSQDGKVSRCIPSASSMPMAPRRFAASGSEKVRRTWYQNWWSSKISALIHSVFAQ